MHSFLSLLGLTWHPASVPILKGKGDRSIVLIQPIGNFID
jgi:hypothetical protein